MNDDDKPVPEPGEARLPAVSMELLSKLTAS